MKKNDWGLEIRKIQDGFVIKDNEGNETIATANDELSASDDLLNQIINFFSLRGGRYDRERIRVIREVGDKYTLQKNEKVLKMSYSQVVRK